MRLPLIHAALIDDLICHLFATLRPGCFNNAHARHFSFVIGHNWHKSATCENEPQLCFALPFTRQLPFNLDCQTVSSPSRDGGRQFGIRV